MSKRPAWFLFSFCALTLMGCGHLFYYPTSRVYVEPERINPAPEVISFKNQDGGTLSGWYFHSGLKKPKAKILFFHGNAQNLTAHFMFLHWIVEHGYDYFIFDYPGYGASDGEPTRKSTTESGQAALDWIQSKKPDVPLVIFGQSLGGNIALYVAAQKENSGKACLVAVDSTFLSYKKVGQRALARQWVTWPLQWVPWLVVGETYSAKGRVDKISPTPLLVIHGDADRVVSFKNGEDVFKAAQEPKEFWRVPAGNHTEAFARSEYSEFRKKFTDKIDSSCGTTATGSKE